MSWNGSGLFNIDSTGQPVSANTLIESSVFNALTADLATGLSNCITKDGQQTITANLPMASYRHTGVGNAVARTDYAAAGQVQDGKLNWVDGGGTADAITATYSPAITALVDGQLCCVRATAANATTTPTFSPNGLTARTIVKKGGAALVAGDIVADGHELILRYDLANTRWELLNPGVYASLAANTFTGLQTFAAGADITSATTVDLTAATGNLVRITGTTATTGVTINNGQMVICYPTGAWPLTYHATNMPIKGGANYTCAAGDTVIFSKDGNGSLHVDIFKADGTALAGGGKIVQVAEGTPYTAYNSSTVAMPYDDSIPQNTEGTEWVTVSITPTNASNRLVIEADMPVVAGNTSIACQAAIFKDSIADALAVTTNRSFGENYGSFSMHVRHEMAAGTTSATTFKLRAGSHDGSTMYVNGNNDARKFGGISAIRIRVTEIEL